MKSNLRSYLKLNIFESLVEQDYKEQVNCIKKTLEEKLKGYNHDKEEWFQIREVLRDIKFYLEAGYFLENRDATNQRINNFLSGLDYSDNHSYEKGEIVKYLFPNQKSPIYKAYGNKTLFRGVSLSDWNRIQKQGFIDSDMRGAIHKDEGINLAQIPSTAQYYLPINDKGVILAISPKKLDLYMLNDEYIRVFEPIPIKNVLKISDIFMKDKHGAILSDKTDKKVEEIKKQFNIINC